MSGDFVSLLLSSLLQNTGSGSQQNVIYSFLLLVAALVSFLIAMVAWKRRRIGSIARTIALFRLNLLNIVPVLGT